MTAKEDKAEAERALAAYERAYWLHVESDVVEALVAIARRVAEHSVPTPDDREALADLIAEQSRYINPDRAANAVIAAGWHR